MKQHDTIVLADSPHAQTVLLGLTLVERGLRVATKVGARRVFVLDGPEAARAVGDWLADLGGADLLVVRADDQVVHKPLLEALLKGRGDRRIAVGPDGEYAGALWVPSEHAKATVDAILATG